MALTRFVIEKYNKCTDQAHRKYLSQRNLFDAISFGFNLAVFSLIDHLHALRLINTTSVILLNRCLL